MIPGIGFALFAIVAFWFIIDFLPNKVFPLVRKIVKSLDRFFDL